MDEAYQKQNGHTAVKQAETARASLGRMADDYRESHAEKQREQCVELAVNQHVLQETDNPVDTCRRHGGCYFGRLERVKGELWIVGKANAEQRKAP